MANAGGRPMARGFWSLGNGVSGLGRVVDRRHERMSVQSDPRSPLEMVDAEYFLELLVRLFADPSL